jgi:NAD(P)-dependent dehydrogenase (short-subunit alcohol dehydrogenase family)
LRRDRAARRHLRRFDPISGRVHTIANRNKLDAVIHNAGVAAAGALEDLPESELRRVMETNFFGVLELTRALLPTFRAQRRGRIVIVSSEAAFMGQPTNSIYCASKWAVEGWAEAIAYELEPFEIDIILVEPILSPISASGDRYDIPTRPSEIYRDTERRRPGRRWSAALSCAK